MLQDFTCMLNIYALLSARILTLINFVNKVFSPEITA